MPGNYRIYRRWTRDGERTLIDTISGAMTGYVYAGSPNQVCFLEVRALSAGGNEDAAPLKLVRAAFDGAGNFVGPSPNKPLGLTLSQAAGGVVTAQWIYAAEGQAAPPEVFNVYVDSGAGFDFELPGATANYTSARSYAATLGPFADGTVVRVLIGAVSAEGIENRMGQPAVIQADASPPAAATHLIAEVIAE